MRVCGRTAGGKEKRLLSITNHNISFAVRAEFIYDCVCGGGRWAAAGRVRTIGAGSAGRVDDRWTDELHKKYSIVCPSTDHYGGDWRTKK